MSEEQKNAIESEETFEVTELDEKELQDVAGGGMENPDDAAGGSGCINIFCANE